MQRILMVVLVVVPSVAIAGGSWTEHTSFRASDQASVKVTDPDGFNVVVASDDGEHAGTIPDVFMLPDHDAYVRVTISAPDGSKWTKRIEVRAGQQTDLSVDFKEAASTARSYVGKFAHYGGSCGKKWDQAIQVEFLRHSDGVSAGTFEIEPKHVRDVEVTIGNYDLRVFRRAGDEWVLGLTDHLDIAKDGWVAALGCKDARVGVFTQ